MILTADTRGGEQRVARRGVGWWHQPFQLFQAAALWEGGGSRGAGSSCCETAESYCPGGTGNTTFRNQQLCVSSAVTPNLALLRNKPSFFPEASQCLSCGARLRRALCLMGLCKPPPPGVPAVFERYFICLSVYLPTYLSRGVFLVCSVIAC